MPKDLPVHWHFVSSTDQQNYTFQEKIFLLVIWVEVD